MNSFTAGLALLLVRGKRRVPAPPPKIIEATVVGSAFPCSSKNGEDSIACKNTKYSDKNRANRNKLHQLWALNKNLPPFPCLCHALEQRMQLQASNFLPFSDSGSSTVLLQGPSPSNFLSLSLPKHHSLSYSKPH